MTDAGHTKPLEDVRDISAITYGFMASKALFAALDFDLFTHIARGSYSAAALGSVTGIPENRLVTLLAALKSLGLVTERHEDVSSEPDFSKATSLNDIGLKLLQSVGYSSPSDADIALALDAHASFTATLEAIAERAQGGRMLD